MTTKQSTQRAEALIKHLQEKELKVSAAYNAPTIDNWDAFNIVEVDRPEDFFAIPHKKREDYLPTDVRGIICPIPESVILTPATIKQCYDAISHSPLMNTSTIEGDVISEIEYKTNKTDILTNKNCELPQSLIDLGNILAQTFDRAIKTPHSRAPTTSFRIHSNNHRLPATHRPTIIANPDGNGTVLYTQDAEGNYTGKRSTPDKSILVFTGLHSAEHNRTNRLNVIHTRHYQL